MFRVGYFVFFVGVLINVFNYTVYPVDVELMTKASEQNDFTELERVMKISSQLTLIASFVGATGLILMAIGYFGKQKPQTPTPNT